MFWMKFAVAMNMTSRQIERHAEVVIGERVVLRRVEDLEQRRRGIAMVRAAELVDLVEQEHRVLAARLLHARDQAAGQRADVRAAVAADIGLVTRATEGDPDVLAPHRPSDRLRDRRLADAGRTREQQDPALLWLLRELVDRQELEHAILHVAEPEVILVEDLRGLRDIEVLVGATPHGSSATVSRYVRITCDSIDSLPMRFRRVHSRVTSLRASSGSGSASSLS